ncbi:MAG: energy transducer TonB, partial [Deltaproteobacteria bacterium]|nr:energy transducer TonB [Deltaproteobacteria bacterium]
GVLRESKNGAIYELIPGTGVQLLLGKTKVTFGYTNVPSGPSMRGSYIPFFTSKDYTFIALLCVSIFLHTAMVKYLGTIEVVKKSSIEEIKELEPRFARLILSPRVKAQAMRAEVNAKDDLKDGEDEEDVDEKIEEKKKEETKKKKAGKKKPERKETTVTKRVKQKGVLGVIGAKGGVLSDFDSDEIWSDVDSLIATAVVDDGKDLLASITGESSLTSAEGLIEGEYEGRSEAEILREKKQQTSFKDKKQAIAAETKSGRSSSEVHGVVKRYSGGLKYLYNNALRKTPTLRGSVTVKFTVSPEGRISEAEVTDSTLNAPALERAIVERIKLWRFRVIKGGRDFTTDYTFDFSPVG